MKQVLSAFCEVSGQVVSAAKSVIFTSKGCPPELKSSLANLTRFKISTNIGKCLGVPLIHDRVTKHTYFEVVERVQQRLAGRKAKFLSTAGRETLIHSTMSATPAYLMQSTWLPSSFTRKLDKLNRTFGWGGGGGGGSEERRKLSLVNWQNVLLPRDEGGLAIRDARMNNIALLGKAIWKIISGEPTIWVEMVHRKYGSFNLDGYSRLSATWKRMWRYYKALSAMKEVLHLELFAIRNGLSSPKTFGFTQICVESDSMDAIKLLKEGDFDSHPLAALLMDIVDVMNGGWTCQVFHILREANQLADSLTKKDHETRKEEELLLPSPPPKMLNFWNDDKVGRKFPRS
ncbi:Putative ribonuclease H protein At1g65750 [Linum grandiflorum]